MQDENISPFKAFFHNKWVWLILSINIIVIIVTIAILVTESSKTAIVEFNIAPIDAKISVNDSAEYSNNNSYYFSPGTYQITISHDNLDTKVLTIELEPNHNLTVSTFLKGAKNNLDFYTLKENYTSFEALAEIASEVNNLTIDHDTSAEEFIADFQNSYRIFDILPIIEQFPSEYGLDYGVHYAYDILQIMDGRTSSDECTKTLCILITDTSGKKEQFALSTIDSLGFNHNAYQIIYKEVDYE